jgi:hypothetical protein
VTKFVPGKPVVTVDPVIDVDAGITEGTHVFELVVEDDDGNLSQPARAVVVVKGRGAGGGVVGTIDTGTIGGRLADAVIERPADTGPAPPAPADADTRRTLRRRRGPTPPR